jgi:hypothetical protein
MDAGKGKSSDFGLSKPSPIRWFERVSAATSFYAAFRPLFHPLFRLAETGHSAYVVKRSCARHRR